MGDKGSGRRIFEESMESRTTVRLDKKHNEVIEKIMKKNKLKTKSEAIRYIIENFKAE